jgi:hypothetical protein
LSIARSTFAGSTSEKPRGVHVDDASLEHVALRDDVANEFADVDRGPRRL